MKLLISCLIVLLLLMSCTKSEENLIGIYQSENVSFFELPSFYFYGFDGYTKGATLALKPHNLFEYLTCANRFSGYWEEFHDSLFLHVAENKYKIDSMKIVGFEGKFVSIPNQPIKFKIEGDLLISQTVNKRGMKLMSKLRKNEP